MVGHVQLNTALLVGQRHDGAHIVLRHIKMHGNDGFADFLDAAGIRNLGRILDFQHLTAGHGHFIDHAGCGGDQVLVELALQTLLHDLHMQQPQKAAAKTKAQRLADFGLVMQRGVVELELFQRIAQRFVLAGFRRVEARKDLRLDFLETGQRLGGGKSRTAGTRLDHGHGVADLGGLQLLDAGDHKTDFAGFERLARLGVRRENAELLGVVKRLSGHQLDAIALGQTPVHHAHQHDHAHIGVVPAVDDHGAQRAVGLALGRRNAGDHSFEDFVDAHAGLGAARNRVGGVNADDVFNLELGVLGIGLRQIHFVEHGHDGHTEVECGVAVGHRLRFHALTGIHDEQRAFARRQRAADFIREVHVAGRVDQIEVVNLAVSGLVTQRSGLRLDGYPTLFLQIHGVQNLSAHLAVLQTAAALDDPVSQRGLAVIDVGNDRKISDVIHQRKRLSA